MSRFPLPLGTALITGASSGIGAAFARHLAGRGHRLVLVARSADRLEVMQADLLAAGSPEVEILPADLTDRADLDRVAERLADTARPIDLLVNNAGLGLGREIVDCTADELVHQVDLNVTAVLLLTRAVLPVMEQRKAGAIINVASIAGLVNGRGSSYSASKAWVVSFSEALAVRGKGFGVSVQALCPGFVRTEFHQRAGIEMAGTSDRLYVDLDLLVTTSLRDLEKGKVVSIPTTLYKVIAAFGKLAPRRLVRAAAGRVRT